MLQHLSWQQYAYFMLIAAAVYYTGAWIVVFKRRLPSLKDLFAGQSIATIEPSVTHSPTVLHVMEELAPVFTMKTTRPELMLALQLKLTKYRHWDEPDFREAVTQYIAQTSATKCSIHLSVEDQRVLWVG